MVHVYKSVVLELVSLRQNHRYTSKEEYEGTVYGKLQIKLITANGERLSSMKFNTNTKVRVEY